MMRAALVWLTLILALPGCASVTIRPVDYSWSFESVLTADADGVVRGEPKTIAFDAEALFFEETGEEGAAANKTVRIIRDEDGYYFVTSPGFAHVYIFKSAPGELILQKKVLVAEEGMEKPFFNRRGQNIELGANGQVYLLNRKGIVPGGQK